MDDPKNLDDVARLFMEHHAYGRPLAARSAEEEHLWKLSVPVIQRYVRMKMRRNKHADADLDDVCQIVSEKLLDCEEREINGAFIAVVIKNTVIDFFRKEKKIHATEVPFHEDEDGEQNLERGQYQSLWAEHIKLSQILRFYGEQALSAIRQKPHSNPAEHEEDLALLEKLFLFAADDHQADAGHVYKAAKADLIFNHGWNNAKVSRVKRRVDRRSSVLIYWRERRLEVTAAQYSERIVYNAQPAHDALDLNASPQIDDGPTRLVVDESSPTPMDDDIHLPPSVHRNCSKEENS